MPVNIIQQFQSTNTQCHNAIERPESVIVKPQHAGDPD